MAVPLEAATVEIGVWFNNGAWGQNFQRDVELGVDWIELAGPAEDYARGLEAVARTAAALEADGQGELPPAPL